MDPNPVLEFRRFSSGRVRFHALQGCDEAWMLELWRRIDVEARARVSCVAPSDGGDEVFVKVYRRRPEHRLLRRLGRGRAASEAAGFQAFARANLPVVPLLAWAEERRFGLLEKGMVVTAKVAVRTVAEVYAETQGREWLEAVIDELVTIHRAGLAHGDPRTRNFLATRPRVTAFDLPSWSRKARGAQVRDLVRCLGSVTKLVGEAGASHDLLSRYEESFGSLPAPVGELRTRILEYSCSKDRP